MSPTLPCAGGMLTLITYMVRRPAMHPLATSLLFAYYSPIVRED